MEQRCLVNNLTNVCGQGVVATEELELGAPHIRLEVHENVFARLCATTPAPLGIDRTLALFRIAPVSCGHSERVLQVDLLFRVHQSLCVLLLVVVGFDLNER
jgi:hypothetical protein